MTPSLETISYGNAVCTEAPMGAHGLEGYSQGQRYMFRRVYGTHKGKRVRRVLVWATELNTDATLDNTEPPWDKPDKMTEAMLKRFFRVEVEAGAGSFCPTCGALLRIDKGGRWCESCHGYK